MVTHILFADNSILFCKTNMHKKILALLEKYESASVQKINWSKTSIAFGQNVKKETQLAIKDFGGLEVIQKHASYLGFPPLVGPTKRRAFCSIKNKVWKKLQR